MGDLTETAITAAEKPQKLFDGQGLHLLVAPPNSLGWRLNASSQQAAPMSFDDCGGTLAHLQLAEDVLHVEFHRGIR
jgi:hypothetical protein